MHRVDLAQAADVALSAMPDDVHAQMLALIDSVAQSREDGARPTTTADAALWGRCWIVYMALGGLLIVLDAGRIA